MKRLSTPIFLFIILNTSCCILLLEFFLPGFTLQLNSITTKNDEHVFIKRYNLFYLFLQLAMNVDSKKERVEEIISAYGVLTGDFTSTVSQDSALTSEHGCLYKQIYSRLTSHTWSGHQQHRYFLLLGSCPQFP